MDSLIVYLNDVPVGRLTDDEGRLSFAYDQAYVDDARNEPLSHVIPLTNETFGPEVMEPFLSGLLPEDIIRTRLGRILQIPRENTFAFLKAIGGDCAGAIAFYAEGTRPSSGQPRFRRLSDAEAGANSCAWRRILAFRRGQWTGKSRACKSVSRNRLRKSRRRCPSDSRVHATSS